MPSIFFPITITPQPAIADTSAYYADNPYFYHVVGEVIGAETPACSVKVSGEFYDTDGNLIATGFTWTALTETNPSQRNPFNLVLFDAPTNIDHYSLEVEQSKSCTTKIVDLPIVSQGVFGNMITGTILNDRNEQIERVTMVAYLKLDGVVVHIAHGDSVKTQLLPNEGSSFEFEITADVAFDEVVVMAQGEIE